MISAKVAVDQISRVSKGYGFVTFQRPDEQTRAITEMNGKYLKNRPIKTSAGF